MSGLKCLQVFIEIGWLSGGTVAHHHGNVATLSVLWHFSSSYSLPPTDAQ